MSPLLRAGAGDNDYEPDEDDDFQAAQAILNAFGGSNSARSRSIMETSVTGSELENRIMTNHPGLRRLLHRWGMVPTLSDSLPSIFQIITTSGKLSFLAFPAVYIIFLLLWLPFKLLSLMITEIGIYGLAVGSIFYFGRVVIRMIAFPGASTKVMSEVETEFAKYSVRMLVAAANCLRDLGSAVSSASGGGADASTNGSNGPPRSGGGLSSYEIPGLWKRAKSYRDRALGVYLEVLTYIYDGPGQTPMQSRDQRTKFGTNRLAGDIGNLNGLTVSNFLRPSCLALWAGFALN